MLSSSLYTMLKLSKTTSPNKLFDYDCVALYHMEAETSTLWKTNPIYWRGGGKWIQNPHPQKKWLGKKINPPPYPEAAIV